MALPGRTDRRLLGLTLLVKLGVLLVGAAAYVWVEGGHFGTIKDAFAIWNRWDAPHYLDLAAFGYRSSDPGNLPMFSQRGDLDLFIVFYPLFPWLVGGVNAALHDPIWSGFVVSTVASLFVAPLLYRVVRREESHAVAVRAAVVALIFPTAYFLHIPYTESLFMALVLGSFLAARSDRWWLAGTLGGLAALTRVNGLILIPALAVEAGVGWARLPREERRLRVEWLAIGLVAVGFGVYLLLNQLVYGDPFTFLRVLHEHWYKSLAPPWQGIAGIFPWFHNTDPDLVLTLGWMELLFVVIGLAGTIHMALRRRWAWFVWMAGNWLLFVSTWFVLSVPRYSLTLFPLFVSLALLARWRWLAVVLSLVSLAGLVYFSGRFANGAWGF
jgi:Gpi18-like mannosyltransferase